MIWLPVSLSVAFFSAAEAALAKKLLGDLPPLTMAAIPLAWCFPLFLSLLLLFPPPLLDDVFWRTLILLVPLNTAGFLLHMSAVNISPLGLTMPLLAFTPAFVIITGEMVLGEHVGPWGVVGILTIAAGSYVLGMREARPGKLLDPLRALCSEPGSRMMLGAAALYGVCSVLGKKLVLHSSPLHATLVFWCVAIPFTLALLTITGRIRPLMLLERPGRGALVGLCMACHFLTHLWAISMVQAAVMIAIKRLSGVFSVLFGRLFFGEAALGFRLGGAFLMFVGAMLLAFAG